MGNINVKALGRVYVGHHEEHMHSFDQNLCVCFNKWCIVGTYVHLQK